MSNYHRLARIEFQKILVSKQVLSTCLNCEHWQTLRTVALGQPAEERQGCALYQHAVPPPDVIVYGCEQWMGVIPF